MRRPFLVSGMNKKRTALKTPLSEQVLPSSNESQKQVPYVPTALANAWWLVFVILGVLYGASMSQTVYALDNGELVAAQYFWGIPHATGYPLFTLLGYLWTRIPIGSDVAWQLALLSGVMVLVGLLVWWRLLVRVLTQTAQISSNQSILIATCLVGMLGIHPIIWSQSLSSEVYSLHILLISLCLLTYQYAAKSQEFKRWIPFGISIGLTFSNHLSSLVVLPLVAYWYFLCDNKEEKLTNKSFRLVLLAACSVIVAAIFYSIMVWRANCNPIINWGNPKDWDSFWYHVLGRQFTNFWKGSVGFSGRFGTYVKESIGWLFFVPFLASLALINARNSKIFVSGLILWLSTGLLAACYDIHDISNYYICGLLGLSMMSVPFFQWLSTQSISVLTGTYAAMVFGFVYWQYPKVEQRSHVHIANFTSDALKALPPKAIVISKLWETFVAPSIYLQQVKGIRTDVAIIDKELLRRSYYQNQLSNWHPSLCQDIKSQHDTFIEKVTAFQYNQPFDPLELQRLYENLLLVIQAQVLKGRPVFLTVEMASELENANGDVKLPRGFQYVPRGPFLQLVPDEMANQYLPDYDFLANIKLSEPLINQEKDLVRVIQAALGNRARYEVKFGQKEREQHLFQIYSSLPAVSGRPRNY